MSQAMVFLTSNDMIPRQSAQAIPTSMADAVVTAERRGDSRIRTVYRIARVSTDHDEGLARIQNISDGGMRLIIGMTLSPGDRVTVALTQTLMLEARVVWASEGECGIQFSRGVDSRDILRRAADEARLGTARPPRLTLSLPIVVVSERGMHITRVHDVSQRGMKIGHDGSFTTDLLVKVILSPGIERRGIVRWVREHLAGLMLIEPFTIQERGSPKAL